MLSPVFRPAGFDRLPGWRGDDHRAAFEAFRRCARQAGLKPYRSGSLGIRFEAFADAYSEALAMPEPDGETAREFFEKHFRPCTVCPPDPASGFVTGFYEPVVEASPVRSDRFTCPLLARPDDLIEIDDANRPPGMEPGYVFGRIEGGRVVAYHDRRAIESGALAGRGLEIAWLADPVDLFFIHVQGAARLIFPGGGERRVTYAAKSGHPFTGPGGVLAALGEIPREEVTMQAIRAWFRRNPGRVSEILWRNRSYIFFREAAVEEPELGPIAAAKVPLTPGRSIAVDRLQHTFGTPFFIDAPRLDALGPAPLRRLMIAQDTGSAIVGPARGDLFTGSGDAAGEAAGVIRHKARFHALVPHSLLESLP